MAAVPSLTLVLMGRTGNGKSATGNSILGRKAFESRKSSSGITRSSELQTCVRKDGQVINVIDTPGMFNLSRGAEYTAREIVKCIDLASKEIHAILLVFSTRTRFTQEEEATIQTLQNSFGPKIVDYAIVVLTGGDEFDTDDDTELEDYLNQECPTALKEIVSACKNRCVVFDNKTKSESKNDEQVKELLGLVNEMVEKNGGQPYKAENGLVSNLNLKLEKEFNEVKSKLEQSCTQDLYNDLKLEAELNEVNNKLRRELEEEREASRQIEERSQQIQRQYRDEIGNQNEQIRIALLERPPEVNVEQHPRRCRRCHFL